MSIACALEQQLIKFKNYKAFAASSTTHYLHYNTPYY